MQGTMNIHLPSHSLIVFYVQVETTRAPSIIASTTSGMKPAVFNKSVFFSQSLIKMKGSPEQNSHTEMSV